MKKVFPCVEILHKENPVLALYWPFTGPVRDCSVYNYFSSNKKYFCFWLSTKMYQFITGFVGSSIKIYEILMTIPALK